VSVTLIRNYYQNYLQANATPQVYPRKFQWENFKPVINLVIDFGYRFDPEV